MQGGSSTALTNAYRAARNAEQVCGRAGLNIVGMDPPQALSRADRKAFDTALDECGLAYSGKAVMFKEVQIAINGDRRPSQLAKVQDAGNAAQIQTLACVLKVTELAKDQGVELTKH